MIAPSERRWFRFSLRTMFVVITVFGLYLGWQLNIVRERKAVLHALKHVIGREEFEYDYSGLESNEADPQNAFDLSEFQYARIPFIRRLLGDETCLQLTLPKSLDPGWIERAEIAFPEAELMIWENQADRRHVYASRSSLYRPKLQRASNVGSIFKTGLIEK